MYGNSLEVLTTSDYKGTVEEIEFQYVRFDIIVSNDIIGHLKQFKCLKKLHFSFNFLVSLSQLAKLESLPHITSIVIENNDVTKLELLNPFIIYRFHGISSINGVGITENEKMNAKIHFKHFDSLLSRLKPKVERNSEIKGQRHVQKKMMDSINEFLNGIIGSCVKQFKLNETVINSWNSAYENIIHNNVKDLQSSSVINETGVRKLVNLC